MSKKNLIKPAPRRQPTPDQISQFVHGGPGKDEEIQKSSKMDRRISEKEEMARLTIDLPRRAHRRFKLACVMADTKMNIELRRMIERRCAELERHHAGK